MKTALLIACTSLSLVGCTTYNYGRGSSGPVYETSSGRVVTVQAPVVVEVDRHHRNSFWSRWQYDNYDTNPDRIAPQLPLDPAFPPAPIP
jgi:hypothetical protein